MELYFTQFKVSRYSVESSLNRIDMENAPVIGKWYHVFLYQCSD